MKLLHTLLGLLIVSFLQHAMVRVSLVFVVVVEGLTVFVAFSREVTCAAIHALYTMQASGQCVHPVHCGVSISDACRASVLHCIHRHGPHCMQNLPSCMPS